MAEPLIEVKGLRKDFPVRSGILQRTVGWVQAVAGVDLNMGRGEVVGLVGESGCGKSTLGRMLVRLLEPSAGTIAFDGTDISHLTGDALEPFRRTAQMISQDPFSSLDPRAPVGSRSPRACASTGSATPTSSTLESSRCSIWSA